MYQVVLVLGSAALVAIVAVVGFMIADWYEVWRQLPAAYRKEQCVSEVTISVYSLSIDQLTAMANTVKDGVLRALEADGQLPEDMMAKELAVRYVAVVAKRGWFGEAVERALGWKAATPRVLILRLGDEEVAGEEPVEAFQETELPPIKTISRSVATTEPVRDPNTGYIVRPEGSAA